VLELLLPFVKGLHYGMTLRLEVPTDQMVFEASVQQNTIASLEKGGQPVL